MPENMMENARIQSAQATINACKSLLADSDYQLIKIVEGMLSCKSIAELLAWFATSLTACGALIENRIKWRAAINAAEAEIAEEEQAIAASLTAENE